MCRKSFLFIGPIVLLSLAGSVMAAPPFQQDPGPDGIVCVEAEHFDNKVKAPNGDEWVEVGPSGGFTGTAGMQALPNNNNSNHNSPGYSTSSCRLDYQINFVKTGTYYVWVYGYGANGNDDSCHAGLDGQEIATCDNMSGWNGRYAWSDGTLDGPVSTFEITAVGVHTLNMYMREDGMIIDKVLLTANATYTPTGDGPAESPRGIPNYAAGPAPANGATDVPRDAILSWKPGPSAVAHDVYLGTVLADVDAASRTNPKGLLVSQAQDANSYDPAGLFELGKVYYWRVDEVGATAASLVKGNVWSFTAEPVAYPIATGSATASSSDAGVGPQNTVNGSGLTNDLHSATNTTMWLSSATGAQPTWIQYAFDGIYRLQEMWVWNYNVTFESVLGYGFKDVTIEYSTNGTDWVALKDMQFAQGTGQDGYAHNTTVNFGGAAAQYVRLTAKSNWGGLRPQYGLSEVRFYCIPVRPRQPSPTSGAAGVAVNTALSWRPGREAASHKVYFGTDQQAVANGTAPVKTVTDHSFDPGPLGFGTTYYWKVAEVNDAANPKVWEGDVWSFSTKESFLVDDFESYTDEEGSRIYQTWVDGWTNGTGSTVGYVNAPFAEQTILHGGKQSMPLDYNNTKSPFYSEAERAWDKPQDWTVNGADTLLVYFRGNPTRFLETTPGTIKMGGGGADIWNAADEFRFAFKRLTGNGTLIAKVESVENTDPWAKGGVMIRESLDVGARFAAVYATPGNGVRYQARLLNAGAATSDTSVATAEQMALKIPVWIKIERTGSSFNCSYSTDGTKWTSMSWNPQTIAMTGTVLIGLAVTSHNTNAETTAQFSNVSMTGSVTASWEVQAIGPVQRVNDAAGMYVAVQDSAGKIKVVTHPDPAATLLTTWQQWRIPLSDLSSAGVKLTGVKKMTIGVGDRSSPKAGGTGLVYLDDIGVGHPAAVNP
jgi:regulation of enolase protein 1 (concanavalin A-like superfamily)